jgi:hypothetical protein
LVIGGSINYVGWAIMVTGFSLVLYSRLHIITSKVRALRFLLAAILVISLLVCVPTFLSGYFPNIIIGEKIYKVASRLEVLFAAREIILASLYTILFIRFVRGGGSEDPRYVRKMLWLLCFAQFITFSCDVILLILVYTDLVLAKNMIQTFSYAIKLEVEFMVLNRLLVFGQRRQGQLVEFEEQGRPGGLQVKDKSNRRDGHIESEDRPSVSPGHNTREMRSTKSRKEVSALSIEGNVSSSPLGVNGSATDKCQNQQRDSMEEMERRYLGRLESAGR